MLSSTPIETNLCVCLFKGNKWGLFFILDTYRSDKNYPARNSLTIIPIFSYMLPVSYFEADYLSGSQLELLPLPTGWISLARVSPCLQLQSPPFGSRFFFAARWDSRWSQTLIRCLARHGSQTQKSRIGRPRRPAEPRSSRKVAFRVLFCFCMSYFVNDQGLIYGRRKRHQVVSAAGGWGRHACIFRRPLNALGTR